MARPVFQSVDDYIAAQPEAMQPNLRRVRGAIRKALPEAEEAISYGIPAYKLHGRPVVYFAGWKQHYSLYPATPRLVTAFQHELAVCEARKGTIRFPLSRAVPVKLIGQLAKFRAQEVAGSVKKAAAPTKRQAG